MHRPPLLHLGVFFLSVLLGIVGSLFFLQAPHTQAQTATSTLQTQIDQTNAQIKQLQDDIAKLQSQLTTTSAQKLTLQNAVTALNLNIQKLQKSITLAQTQINQKNSQISQINTTISTTTSQIGEMEDQVASSLRQLNSFDNESLLAALLSGGTISSFLDQATTLASLRTDLENKIEDLNSLKSTLTTNETAAEAQKAQLASYQQTLAEQKQGLSISKDSQTKLLTQTKNQESAYQAQIAEKQKEEAGFESDLLTFQSKLNLSFNASSLPSTGQGALQWPLAHVYGGACPAPAGGGWISCITQYFGNTPFATANPQIYSGHGHSGVDLAASPGTPVLAAREGVVLGTGNTDLTCPGASFGKWIFIKHDNGLSTLYGHLASFAVAKGDMVTTGEVIGYSDTTGYATGPHLHFGVYASGGSEIASFASSGCPGKTYTMPVADLSAYLNPLSYLPGVQGQ